MLYFIPTPIWNLYDITLRALKLFNKLDIFFCEDTRTFKKLLNHYQIDFSNKKLYSITSYTSKQKLKFYTKLIKENDAWVVSEAWTPWLSDPGKELIKICYEENIKFEVLPWANALVPSIVSACFDTSKFIFLGFLPQKKWRQTLIKKIIKEEYPVFFYESVHRIEKTLNQLKENNFSGTIFVIREISKMFEEKICWSVEEILEKIKNKELILKWEFVLWIKNNKNA